MINKFGALKTIAYICTMTKKTNEFTDEEIAYIVAQAQYQFGQYLFSKQRYDRKAKYFETKEEIDKAMATFSDKDLEEFYEYIEEQFLNSNVAEDVLNSLNLSSGTNPKDIN